MKTVNLSDAAVGPTIGKDGDGSPVYSSVEGRIVYADGTVVADDSLIIMSNGRQIIVRDGRYYRLPTDAELQGSQKTGKDEGVIRKEVVTTTSKDCPCEVREVPYNLYLSRQQTAGSVPIRATQKKVVCQTPPTQKPDVPCDELQRALQTMNGTSNLEGITSSVIDTIKFRPVGSAIEIGAGIAAGVYADRQFSTPIWATIGIAVAASMIAGKITDSVGI